MQLFLARDRKCRVDETRRGSPVGDKSAGSQDGPGPASPDMVWVPHPAQRRRPSGLRMLWRLCLRRGGRALSPQRSGLPSSERLDRILRLSLNQSAPGLHRPHLLPLELGQDLLTPRREKGRSLSRTVGCRVKGCEAPQNQEISSAVAQQVTEEPQSLGAG